MYISICSVRYQLPTLEKRGMMLVRMRIGKKLKRECSAMIRQYSRPRTPFQRVISAFHVILPTKSNVDEASEPHHDPFKTESWPHWKTREN